MIQQTSLDTYFAEVKPHAHSKRQIVLEAIEEIQPCNNREIAKHLGWEINSITGRVHELRTLGKVIEAFKAHDTNGRKTIFWKPAPASSKEFGDVA